MTQAIVTKAGAAAILRPEAPEARVTGAGLGAIVGLQPPVARATKAGVSVVVRSKPPRDPRKSLGFTTIYSEDRGIVNDPLYGKVELLLNADDQGVFDLSKHRRPLHVHPMGTTYWKENPKYGPACIRFYRMSARRGRGMLRVLGNQDGFWFGSEPFTVECWLRNESPYDAYNPTRTIIGRYNFEDGGRSWHFGTNEGALRLLLSDDGVTSTALSGPVPPLNTWVHAQVDRDRNGRVRMYVNGEMVSWADFPQPLHRPPDDVELMIGNAGTWNYGRGEVASLFYGIGASVDDLRVTRGWARNGSDVSFEPPQRSSAFIPLPDDGVEDTSSDPYWDQVTMLLDPSSTTTLADLSQVQAPVTGTPYRETGWEFWGRATAAMRTGSGGQITIANLGQADFGREPFTIEVVGNYQSTGGGSDRMLEAPGAWRISNSASYMWFSVWDGTAYQTVMTSSSLGLHYNTTFLVVVTRDDDGVGRFYLNGRLVAEKANLELADPTGDFGIGGGDMYLHGARITKGICRIKDTSEFPQDAKTWLKWPTYGPPYVPPAPPPHIAFSGDTAPGSEMLSGDQRPWDNKLKVSET